jgi:hypothetical protein
LVEWKEGSSSSIPLADLKDAYPVQVSDDAVANNLTTEPAFHWWVPFVLKKRERILKKVKTKYWSNSHKYGLELPKSVSHSLEIEKRTGSVSHALEIDKRTGKAFWKKAIKKEISLRSTSFLFAVKMGLITTW